ncbi:MAG: hypothetical protein C5B52_05860 [Bacteroidetes bacterium]|nr:MAG: hypothetical protein C5B52_05860 [Bacteroidota bacterium]
MEIAAKKWVNETPPSRILAIRLQAMGDTVITLPYLQDLRTKMPVATQIDFLTRKEVSEIPQNLELFHKVYALGGGRSEKLQLAEALFRLPELLMNRYDMVLDLQNNKVSRFVRKSLATKSWSEFDRFSPISAGERTRLTIEAAGIDEVKIDSNLKLKKDESENILLNAGWDKLKQLIILNPAGAFETRNWPLDNYVRLAELWLQKDNAIQFLILGTNQIGEKAKFLKDKIGEHLINLVGQTNSIEAFAIIQKASIVISEDSGLMHMAWVSGIPVLVMFGSTRSDWSRPLGENSVLLDSSDLECGNCMRETCIYGDNRCLTRYTPDFVLNGAFGLLSN